MIDWFMIKVIIDVMLIAIKHSNCSHHVKSPSDAMIKFLSM